MYLVNNVLENQIWAVPLLEHVQTLLYACTIIFIEKKLEGQFGVSI